MGSPAIPRTLPPRPDAGGLPLAGSRLVRFDGADGGAGDGADGGADPALAERRADLCGLVLDRPRIMGILNVTPDSFSDGGRHNGLAAAVARAKGMLAEGAEILDIGGESTRPGAGEVPVAEEIARVVPVISALREAGVTAPVSIDTRKARVAAAALAAGADMVNDVTALRFDPEMAGVVAAAGVPVCLMHSIADPATMQARAVYDDVLAEVHDHLAARVAAAGAAGIARDRIVVDPGIGFGKTVAHNLTLIRGLAAFHGLGCAVLLGASRKRFIGALGGTEEASDRVAGSVAVALYGAAQGAQVLRVHDVKETVQALRLWSALAAGETDNGA
jgi:dihydropteroate synthase